MSSLVYLKSTSRTLAALRQASAYRFKESRSLSTVWESFLTWFRSLESGSRPGPQWTSRPSSSRWAGSRRRCSQRTLGMSGSPDCLQRWKTECQSCPGQLDRHGRTLTRCCWTCKWQSHHVYAFFCQYYAQNIYQMHSYKSCRVQLDVWFIRCHSSNIEINHGLLLHANFT